MTKYVLWRLGYAYAGVYHEHLSVSLRCISIDEDTMDAQYLNHMFFGNQDQNEFAACVTGRELYHLL